MNPDKLLFIIPSLLREEMLQPNATFHVKT